MNAQTLEPWVRNFMRVLSGYLMAKGSDPEFAAFLGSPEVVGAVTWVATEAWYAIAKRKGWAT